MKIYGVPVEIELNEEEQVAINILELTKLKNRLQKTLTDLKHKIKTNSEYLKELRSLKYSDRDIQWLDKTEVPSKDYLQENS